MFPGEMVILMAIALAGDSVKRLLDRPMDVSGEYICYLYDSLVKRGYLTGDGSNRYQLTLKGKKALGNFLYENEDRVMDLVKTLQKLDIEIGQETADMEKKAVAVR